MSRIPHAVQPYQIDSHNDAIDEPTDFALHLSNLIAHAAIKAQDTQSINCPQYDLTSEWWRYTKRRANRPCFCSSLNLLGFKWLDDEIFALWLSQPQWFDNSSETALAAAAHPLKQQGWDVSIARTGDNSDIC